MRGGHRATTACSPFPQLGRIALMHYTQCREQYSADIGRNRDWEFVSSAFAARCWSLTALSLKGRAAALRIIWDKGDQYSTPQRTFLCRCTVCAGDDSADHWIRRCPHTAMVQYQVDCTNSIVTYIQSIKTHAFAQLLWKVLAMTTHEADSYRIWTANWATAFATSTYREGVP